MSKKAPKTKKEHATFILYDDVVEVKHKDDDGKDVATSAEMFVRRFLVSMTFDGKILQTHVDMMRERIQGYCEKTFHEALFLPSNSKTKQSKKDIFNKHHKKRNMKNVDFSPVRKKDPLAPLFDSDDVKKMIEDNVVTGCADLLKNDADESAKYLKLKVPTIDVEECMMDIDGTKTSPSRVKEKNIIKIDL